MPRREGRWSWLPMLAKTCVERFGSRDDLQALVEKDADVHDGADEPIQAPDHDCIGATIRDECPYTAETGAVEPASRS